MAFLKLDENLLKEIEPLPRFLHFLLLSRRVKIIFRIKM